MGGACDWSIDCCGRTLLCARLQLKKYACDCNDFHTIVCRNSRRKNRVFLYIFPLPVPFTRSTKLPSPQKRKMHKSCIAVCTVEKDHTHFCSGLQRRWREMAKFPRSLLYAVRYLWCYKCDHNNFFTTVLRNSRQKDRYVSRVWAMHGTCTRSINQSASWLRKLVSQPFQYWNAKFSTLEPSRQAR